MDDSFSFSVTGASILDIPEIMEVGKKWIADLPFDPDFDMLEKNLFDCITEDNNKACVILAKTDDKIIGVIICYTSLHQLFKGKLVAQEPLWLVVKEYRGYGVAEKLLSLYEEWSNMVGCSTVFCGSFLRMDNKMLESKGYSVIGTNYMKELK